MITDIISDRSQAAAVVALDGLAARHRSIAANLANSETPGYKRVDVAFEGQLRDALERGASVAETLEVHPIGYTDTTRPAGPDGNNTDVDQEMAALAANTIRYEALVQALSIKGEMLRTAISEGRR